MNLATGNYVPVPCLWSIVMILFELLLLLEAVVSVLYWKDANCELHLFQNRIVRPVARNPIGGWRGEYIKDGEYGCSTLHPGHWPHTQWPWGESSLNDRSIAQSTPKWSIFVGRLFLIRHSEAFGSSYDLRVRCLPGPMHSRCWLKDIPSSMFGTDCDQDRITWGNPQKWCSDSLPFLIGHLGVRAPYDTRRKLRYEANQVWMNTTFISQGPQSSGILAVETWRVKTELIIITILHIIIITTSILNLDPKHLRQKYWRIQNA